MIEKHAILFINLFIIELVQKWILNISQFSIWIKVRVDSSSLWHLAKPVEDTIHEKQKVFTEL